MRRTLRIKNSPVAMFYSRINAFIIVLRVNFSLSDNFLLLFSICLKLPFHPQYKYTYLLSLTFSFSLSSLSLSRPIIILQTLIPYEKNNR